MPDLFVTVSRWLLRHLLSFVLIVAVLVLGRWVWDEFQEYRAIRSAVDAAQAADAPLQAGLRAAAQEARLRVAQLQAAPAQVLQQRVAAIDRELLAKRHALQQLSAVSGVFSGVPLGRQLVQRVRLDAEIALLERERDYLVLLGQHAVALASEQTGRTELEWRRLAHVQTFGRLQVNRRTQELLLQQHPVMARLPGSAESAALRDLERAEQQLLLANQEAYQRYRQQYDVLQRLAPVQALRRFELPDTGTDTPLQPLARAVADLQQRLAPNWVARLTGPVQDVLPQAAAILLAILLLPLLIKLVFYFVLAPLAARRPPIRLLPGVAGDMALAGGASAVSAAIELGAQDELLVRPEFLQSAALGGHKQTQWLLDGAYPLTSLASGMVALTRIRTDAPLRFVVSATRDPLGEIGVLELPEGSAIVIQPHNLVGLVKSRAAPVHMSRHWRLGSLHAWLTLQLRYLAFHGPARLIVQGCRGVRLEPASAGRSINQAATIGFGANLAYSTRRCETFSAYLLGRQELLNDSFSGADGFYLYQEMPQRRGSSAITGRGLEGLSDSLLKILGV